MACVVVLGVYRSGTSAVAGALHHMGVCMGSSFDEPSHANEKGYFEDLELKNLHGRIAAGEDVSALYKIAVAERERDHPLWGVKDPLVCLIGSRVFPLLPFDTKFVVVRRPLQEVCNSIAKAIGFSDATKYMPLVELYASHLDALAADLPGPSFETSYQRFIKEDKEAEVRRLAEFVGLEANGAALEFVA